MLASTVHYVPLEHFGRVAGWAEASAHDHSAVLDALAAGDPEAARRTMADHIDHVGSLLMARLTGNGVVEPPRRSRSEASGP